jgi:hypothetical protein
MNPEHAGRLLSIEKAIDWPLETQNLVHKSQVEFKSPENKN